MGDAAPERWTCEACGCHTNQSSDRSCTICGTSPSAAPSILRRPGGFASRVGWIARGLHHPEDMDESDLWESVVDRMAEGSAAVAAAAAPPPPSNPGQLRLAAAAHSYQPQWAKTHRDWEIQPHVALARSEGRAIRTTRPLPSDQGPVGFTVAFQHPSTAEVGDNMGGCHLIGVTTSAFSSYTEPNALQQSAFFWGIEDGGQKYQGRRRSRYEFVEAPLTTSNVLFGSQQNVTVVCDWESRSLTFWRDGVLLGTLVTQLPRNTTLYPAVVPFNCGVVVAISRVQDNPLPLLQSFASNCRREREEKETAVRQKLQAKRSILMHKKSPTAHLKRVLKAIFESYGHDSLDSTQACRLWYRCGIKLSQVPKTPVQYQDFLAVVNQVLHADNVTEEATEKFRAGDKVELAPGFEKFGDSAGGPLQPRDRGTVVELQHGPNGEPRSIRVFHNGRRWWYQPQAIISERSGLIDSPAVWFLDKLLRAHGYDAESLELMAGKPVASSWRVADVVIPKKSTDDEACFGRIVPEVHARSSSSFSRDSGMINVEFIDRSFANALGIRISPMAEDPLSLQTKRIRASKLLFGTAPGCSGEDSGAEKDEVETMEDAESKHPAVQDDAEEEEGSDLAPVSDKLKTEIAAVSRFEQSAMDALAKECNKSSDTLASLFSAGLPEAVVSAIDVAAKQMNSLEPREDLFEKIAAIGGLISAIAEKLYSDKPSANQEESPPNDPEESDSIVSEHADEQSALLAAAGLPVGRRGGDDLANIPQLMNASLQQRRGMLLSLLSRGGRRRALNDLDERRGAIEASLAQGPFGLHPSFVFSAPLSNESGNNTNSNSLWEGNVPGADISPNQPSPSVGETSVLDSILRCRGDSSEALSGSLRQGGPTFFAFVRHLISHGILLNNHSWVKALTGHYQSKKSPSTHRSSSSILRNAVDEDGVPILQLAILLGCNTDIIRHLITCGTPVGVDELKKAASTNQPQTLSLLLAHASYSDNSIQVEDCSDEVKKVLSKALERQNQLDRQMREAAGTFIASVVKKLISLGLASRRNRSNRTVICSKVICGILVGDVLLRALQHAQKPADTQEESSSAVVDQSGRVPVEDSSTSLTPEGILRYLPREVVCETIFSDKDSATSFFLLLEDYLCSKDMFDAAAGLTLLSIMLKHFPNVRFSPLLERYGFPDLVSFHDVLSSNRIAEILSKDFTSGLDVSSGKGESSSNGSPGSQRDGTGLVRCPKKHACVLHITRHSSFRCDICGSGVERGKPMHGCRECDWDACEQCTDRSESGLIKCSSIKELACDCLCLMSEDEKVGKIDSFLHADILDDLSRDDSTTSLNDITSRLLQHDTHAIKELAVLLQEPGRVSFHQFSSVLLPAIHASLSGRLADGEAAIVTRRSRHKKKKARVAGSSDLAPDSRFEYCRASVHSLLEDIEFSEESKERDTSFKDTEEGDKSSVLGSNPPRTSFKGEIAYSTLASELLRRIHQILSFYENVNVFSTSPRSLDASGREKGGELHTLTKPVELQLAQYCLADSSIESQHRCFCLSVEPLVSVADLELQVLRSCKVEDPVYLSYCQSLVLETSVILERPAKALQLNWKIAKVVGYDEHSGAHCVQYASLLPQLAKNCVSLDLEDISFENEESIVFDGPMSSLVLAARDYVVVSRKQGSSPTKKPATPPTRTRTRSCSEPVSRSCSELTRAVGTRVESSWGMSGSWKVFTLLGVDTESSSRSKRSAHAVLVSDDGEVFSSVPAGQIRLKPDGDEQARDSVRLSRLGSDDRSTLRRSFPFTFGTRQRSDSDASPSGKPGALKRTWSAIALASSMHPLEISTASGTQFSHRIQDVESPAWLCQIGGSEVTLTCQSLPVEFPPKLSVKFSTSGKLPSVPLSPSKNTTLAHALAVLGEWPIRASSKLFFTVSAEAPRTVSTDASRRYTETPSFQLEVSADSAWSERPVDRSRKFSARSPSPEDEDAPMQLCEGLDEICMQCMDVIGILSQHAEDSSERNESDQPTLPGFANQALSKKLSDQLDDALCVVGGALPQWCTLAPTFAPRAFSYHSRQLLLQRAAFGVSRSALKQQESKVNVGRLRQRMASLRARAVELMGEAFSGGAEDPTALQLQADELYGMEETLAARVRAAFRATRWQEHSLQVAKAAVRRDSILQDTAAIMKRYANDEIVNRRRLEVRFDGETGFDAASGDEAGVTRGFYADVAEALLSSENVAGVMCSSTCARVPSTLPAGKPEDVMDIEGEEEQSCKPPLWIPDMDTSAQVVIPTPRADPRSSLGVYPRPLPRYHPQLPEVLFHFQLMGRLFAAAMRDGFMFPLPLSSSFLKLVQHGTDSTEAYSETNLKPASPRDLLLTAADLPRPGFLGGEVYAADVHICRALDALDAADPPLKQVDLQRRYQEIASDKNFARVAFGMAYDCSFEDYFQDRTFVDPLDPTQGDEAVPLCAKGHKKAVTIYNVREWVALAKAFILQDGVISQAASFRKGVEDFFSSQFLRLFTPEELQRDVCGTGDNVDSWDENAIRKLFKLNGGKGAAEALVAVAAIGGEGGAVLSRRFGPSSPTIAFLVKALLEAMPRQRRQFLSFVTSVPIVTPGRIEVVPVVSPGGEFLPMRDPTCLPRANTCARRLYLPKFDTYESFSSVLWAVVREESRFKGFYEWRGAS